jgi:hypothetical protein
MMVTKSKEEIEQDLKWIRRNAEATIMSVDKALKSGSWEIELGYLTEKTGKQKRTVDELVEAYQSEWKKDKDKWVRVKRVI